MDEYTDLHMLKEISEWYNGKGDGLANEYGNEYRMEQLTSAFNVQLASMRFVGTPFR